MPAPANSLRNIPAPRCMACRNPYSGPGLQCPDCREGKSAPTPRQTQDGPAKPELPPKALLKTEEEIRMELREWCELMGAVVVIDTEQGYRPDRCKHCGESTGKGTTRIVRGFPDLIVFWRDRPTWWIEAKSATGKQSEHQRQFQAWCEAAGEIYILARSVEDLLEVERRMAA